MYRDFEYAKLKKSFAFIIERYMPAEIVGPGDPLRFLEQLEKQRMAMARRGLAVAIADSVEGTQDFSPAAVREADEEMEKIGAYTLTFLRTRFMRKRTKL
ncbi:MAG: hypothetical protein M3R59_06750 [Verrucomicrobiota bacterium]|nr:hypothetical protein [Verrucomicrobiota bacterium]